jgi:hypothetical protein
MSTGSHTRDVPTEERPTDEQAVDEQGHDEHGSDEPALGPVDVPAWAAAIGGVLIGVAVAFCFALATAPT